jgi:hypothetical protein
VQKRIQYALLLGSFLALAPRGAHAQWFPPPPPVPYAFDDFRGAVRIEVTPREAEVYVDGYYAGIVDDFDGTFQRLRVTPGPHEIVVRHDGYHNFREAVYLSPDVVHRIRRNLEPLAAGEPEDPRPAPADSPRPGEPSTHGALVIGVQPGGAEIFIDGDRWDGPEGDERLVMQLPEGPHRVEVRKEGFAAFSTSVQIRRGETVPLNVSLSRPSPR